MLHYPNFDQKHELKDSSSDRDTHFTHETRSVKIKLFLFLTLQGGYKHFKSAVNGQYENGLDSGG